MSMYARYKGGDASYFCLYRKVYNVLHLSLLFFPQTVCVEKNETLGGTCLNVGCIPSKVSVQSLS